VKLSVRIAKNMCKLISISGTSGAGKTTIAKHLADSIPFSKLVLFDDHDDKVVFPKSYPKAMPDEFELSMLSEFIRTEKKGTPDLIVFDYPFGRMNKTLNPLIDVAVFLNVPLDVSMARRVRRELKTNKPSDYEWLLSQLENWEKGARDFCMHWEESIAKSCDLVINSISSPESIVDEIIKTYI
jgi:uridine kinase